MKTLLLAGLAGAVAMLPAAASANDMTSSKVAPASTVQNPDANQVSYDGSILMNDDRVIAGDSSMRGGSSTYQGDWTGAYREDGTYQGQWQGTYRDANGKVYDGQYAGTFIGEGNPSRPNVPQNQAPVQPVIAANRAGTDYEAPRYEDPRPEYLRPQYSQAPVTEYRAPAPYPPNQTQYRYPSGWNGYYYPAYGYPGGTTIVIQSAPGTTTTTTYYED